MSEFGNGRTAAAAAAAAVPCSLVIKLFKSLKINFGEVLQIFTGTLIRANTEALKSLKRVACLWFTHTHTHTPTHARADTEPSKKKSTCPVFVAQTTKTIHPNDFCKLDITLSEHPMFGPATNYSTCWTAHTITAHQAKVYCLMNMGKKIWLRQQNHFIIYIAVVI